MRNLLLALLAASALTAADNPNQALVNRYCVTCHNQKLRTAKLAFDQLDLTHPEKDALTWERAIRKLRGGMMPPPGAPRPPLEAVNSFATYLEDSLDKAGAANFNPGSVRIHRLNRTEYANAMRDLFGIEVDASALLPTDDLSDGFDNIAKALKASPSFLDQYIMAARAVAHQAVGAPPSSKEVTATIRGMDPGISLPPGARTGVTTKFVAAYDGDYEIRATGKPALFTVDGNFIDVNARTHLSAGVHVIVSASGGHSRVESEGALFGFVPNGAATGYASTGTIAGGYPNGVFGSATSPVGLETPAVTVKGPFNPTGKPIETASRTRIFVCRASQPAEESACASRIVSNLARMAYRRPVTEKYLAPLMRFYEEGRTAATFEGGVENALVAMLSSTKFLYRVEPPPAGTKPGSIYRLNGTELASRLAFFLWSSLPDEALLNAAEQGKLSDPKSLEHEVRRMLADPRSNSLTTNFAFQWLKIRDNGGLRTGSQHLSGLRRRAQDGAP